MSFSFTGVNELRCAKTVVAVSLAPKQCWISLWRTGRWAVKAWLHLHRWHTMWWEPPKGLAGSATEDPASGVPSQCWQRCRVSSCHQITGGRNVRTHVGREIAGEPAESGEQTRHEVSQRGRKALPLITLAVWGAGSHGWAEAAVPLSPRSLRQAGVGACCTCMPGYSGAEVVPHADVLRWLSQSVPQADICVLWTCCQPDGLVACSDSPLADRSGQRGRRLCVTEERLLAASSTRGSWWKTTPFRPSRRGCRPFQEVLNIDW